MTIDEPTPLINYPDNRGLIQRNMQTIYKSVAVIIALKLFGFDYDERDWLKIGASFLAVDYAFAMKK